MEVAKKSKLIRAAIDTLLAIVILGGTYLLVTSERQNIYDWWALHNYHPPSEIVSLANQDMMTPYTRKVFYVNHPKIDQKIPFAAVCPNNSEQSVVLGCYHSGQEGIYILSVNNSKLAGIEQVTAAYETLHAIYQRLSPSEQKELNGWLLSFEAHGLNNAEVEQQIAIFKQTEPTDVLNEMTSLFGTEVTNLPPQLTDFYKQYFTNRQVILNYYNDYEAAFTSTQNQISSDNLRLSNLNSQITSGESSLSSQRTTLISEQASLNQQQTLLNQEEADGQIDQYNAGVGSYNLQADSYNQQIVSYKTQANSITSLINQFNQLLAARNAVALEEQQLYQSISPPPKAP